MGHEAGNIAQKLSKNDGAKQKVSEAAIRCFKQYGPQRTSMADIAEEAGISRKTLYRIFDDRPALIEHIIQQRLYAFAKKLHKKLTQIDDFEEAIIEGSLFVVQISRADTLFNDIIKKDTNHRLELFLFAPVGQLKKDIVELWSDAIHMGRKQSMLRDDLSDERIVELLGNVQSLLLIRDDYDDAQQRALLVDLLLPALRPQ